MAQKPGTSTPEYLYVCFDVDPTGRRFIDEICQLAAYSPTSNFKQYVMPYNDIDVTSRKKHLIRTTTVGRYRILKSMVSGKIIPTKTEIFVMQDFLAWLESLDTTRTQKIILITFENYTFISFLLLDAMKRYNLTNRFRSLVHGIVNILPFVKSKCELCVSSFSLKVLSKILLDKDQEDICSAHNRARITYQILQHLCAGGNELEWQNIANNILSNLQSLDDVENDLSNMKNQLELQKTLKPIFFDMLSNPRSRKKASYLKRTLAVSEFDYSLLKTLWAEGKESLQKKLMEKLSEVDTKDLVTIIDEHFSSNGSNTDQKRSVRRRNKRDSSVTSCDDGKAGSS